MADEVVMKCIGFAAGHECPALGQYLKSYDPDGDALTGLSVWTWDVNEAIHFADAGAAFACWNQVRKSDPVRLYDGKPNKPLTAMSITVEKFLPRTMPLCIVCGKLASELEEYTQVAKEEGIEVADYVAREEGTFNSSNGHFACTDCYLFKLGSPVGGSRRRWIAP